MENNPHATLVDDFNPFNGNSFAFQLNVGGLFYEPMLMFNTLKPNTAYSWLAKDFAWNADGTAITFTLRDGVKFSDGTPLTADDVAWNYQILTDSKANANRLGLPVVSATADSANTVTVTFKSPQYQNLYNIAGQTFIVQKKHYAAAKGDFSKFADAAPVGTGAYTLSKFSPQGVVFKSRTDYWGGTPGVPEVDVPAYATNDVALAQLAAGKIDYAGNFISQIDTAFVAKYKDHNKYWFPPVNTVNLVFNVKTGPAAFKDVAVRKAISAAIDRQTVSDQAEQGYAPVATSSSGIVLPNFDSLLPAAYKDDLKAAPDLDAVNTLMTGGGYAKGADGIWAKGGAKVSFKIEDPSAYTDYFDSIKIIASDLKKAGFDATADGVDPGKWYSDLGAGTFDAALHWGSSGPSPYPQFAGWLDIGQAQGTSAANDFGRYDNPDAAAALAAYAKAGTADETTAAITTLSKIISEEVPVAPVMYGPGWYEYNTTNYTGWVDADHQFVDPSPNPANCAMVILQLKPAS